MASSSQTTVSPQHPVRFSVAYPDRGLNRLTTAFRLIVAIPILIIAGALGGSEGSAAAGEHGWKIAGGTGGLLFMAPLLMILFRQKYPRWWFDWNRELLRFSTRIGVYVALMDDRYPSTDEQQGVELDFPYPNAKQELNRWLPLVKWLLAIPHYIVLLFLSLAAIVSVIIAWFAILFTGRYPRGLFDFLVLAGECLLLVEGEERLLEQWDFVHCPAWTEHVFVGAGSGPCAILMVGARPDPEELRYPVVDVARKHDAGVAKETSSGDEAYAAFPEPTAGPYREGMLPGRGT